ncbi:hypothetical protein L1987_87353 [Smallanthus sonchifolius]|nr:hypothetical protein L1987_87353 [Smallanthus sonchifolius]
MTTFQGFVPILVLLGLVLTSVLVHAQNDQSGFISIDCGIVEGSSYTDNVTNINYVSDADFIDSGEIHTTLPIYDSFSIDTQLTTLRSFPQNTRNCYTLKPTQGKGNRYLIRARFMYGNYDFKGQLPEFDVYLGPDYWDTIRFNSSSEPITMEIIHVLSSDYTHVCLVNTGRGTPFVSAIELRLLVGDMYNQTSFGSLYLFRRLRFGIASGTVIRYKADKYDRLWSPFDWPDTTSLYTSDEVDPRNMFDPPSEVMSNAITPKYSNVSLEIDLDPGNTTVDAMLSLRSTYKLTKNWQGDPCTPQDFVWDGVGCIYNDTESPRIVLFNLKGNNFAGPIPSGLLEKANKGSLLLSFDGESTGDPASSCDRNNCKNKKDNKIIVPLIAVASTVFVILIALVVVWKIKKTKEHGRGLETRKKKYTYSEVQNITNNFNVVLGKGAFGTVYHGKIGDTQVAVKMLSKSSLQGDKEFQAEANLLLSVHHTNLTSLVGYCNDESHKGIIYEYMANGNLETHLLDTRSSVLNWEKRLQIGCDAAHGLEYLHHGCRPPIVHRDVKCNNILLNEAFQAKLADFGLSKAFPTEGVTHISTEVAGTPGYLDPEYYASYRLTEKSDVYSFGVVLLVIITGQPAITKYDNDNIPINRLVNLKLALGDINNIVDPNLQGNFDANSAWKTVELAMACVADTPSKRPTMKEVVIELNDSLVTERAREKTKSNNLTGLMSLNLEIAHHPTPV